MSASSRPEIFISYSHRDAAWLERLQIHLRPLERKHRVERWDDTRLRAGADWRTEIREAVGRARAAVLLISADFLASEFIASDELPPLLAAAQNEGVSILPLIVGPSGFSRTSELSRFQAFNDPRRPLSTLTSSEAEQVLDNAVAHLEQVLTASAPVAPAPSKPPATVEAPLLVAARVERALLAVEGQPQLYVPLVRVHDTGDIELFVAPEDGGDRMMLQRLRDERERGEVGIAYGLSAATGRVKSVEATREGGRDEWRVMLARAERGYSGMEMTVNGVTPDEQAQIRARRVLLGEPGPRTDDLLLELAISGRSGKPSIDHSPLPGLYREFGHDRDLFLEAARLFCTLVLYTTRTVEHVLRLDLDLRGRVLHIDFEGVRPRAYTNVAPKHLCVQGELTLT